LNINDQSIFHRGSMYFEILSSVILILCPSQILRRNCGYKEQVKRAYNDKDIHV
jgi:hypothetical protein